ncbi:hypothetical protein KLL70_10075 [Clostridioides difficile]|nr:hypothetical protein [Clostridioides difficile]
MRENLLNNVYDIESIELIKKIKRTFEELKNLNIQKFYEFSDIVQKRKIINNIKNTYLGRCFLVKGGDYNAKSNK